MFSFTVYAAMVKTIVISIVLLALALVALGVKVLFVKNGKFPSGHAHDIERRRRQTQRNVGTRYIASAANPANTTPKHKK